MSTELQTKIKKILSDPMAALLTQHPNADADKKTQLNKLCDEMQSFKNKSREIQSQTNIISRQIGDAKRSNQDTADLIQSMRAQSSQHKQLKTELEYIENKILDYFIIDNNSNSPNTNKPLSSRQYNTNINNIDEVTVSILENEDADWNDYVSKQAAATIHHMAEWKNLLYETYGIESFYFLARDRSKQIVGILPLVRLNSRLFGDLLVSMPYFQRGGAIADNPLVENKLIQFANDHARYSGIEHIEYRDDIAREGLPVQTHKVNMVLSLPDSEEALWQGFTPKLRAQIKRPQRESPLVLIGSKEYLDDFYKVYSRNMRDLGSPGHSKKFIENILNDFPDNSWLIVLRLNNKPVSAGLLLGHRQTMEIPLASTIRDVNPLSMNMLLYWEVLKLAISQGYKEFDFGRSSKNAGTYRFKQQWGAQPKQLYWHYWLGTSKEVPSLNPSNPKYALVINIWKRLPLKITNWLGPLIIKNLP